MKWRPSPVECERIADSQDGRHRIVWRQCEPPQHDGWPPVASEVFMLWRGGWTKEWDRKKAREVDVWRGQLVGAYESLAAAIGASRDR